MRSDNSLVRVREELAGWSKGNFPRNFSKSRMLSPCPEFIGLQVNKGRIEAGVARSIQKVEAVSIVEIFVY